MANKFRAKKVEIDGHKFDSKFEGAVYTQLKLRQAAGEISELTPHPCKLFLSSAKIEYRPDFSFVQKGQLQYGEAKGKETAEWRLKKRLYKFYGSLRLDVFTGIYPGKSWRLIGIRLKETIIPQGGEDAESGRHRALHEEGKPKSKAKKRNEKRAD